MNNEILSNNPRTWTREDVANVAGIVGFKKTQIFPCIEGCSPTWACVCNYPKFNLAEDYAHGKDLFLLVWFYGDNELFQFQFKF